MPRTARRESSTGIYHVVIKGVNHETIFKTEKEKRVILFILKEKLEEYSNLEIYAYCIMPTHVHLLIRGKLNEVSKWIGRCEIVYAMQYNDHMERNGHLFQNRYYSECVENEVYFWNCLNYIHNNPVKAQLVDEVGEYEYSSYREYVREKKNILSPKAIKMLEKHFTSVEAFENFSMKNKQNSWFIGTDEEIRQQKNELILYELKKLGDFKLFENRRKKIRYSDYTKMMAQKLNVSQVEIIEKIMELKGEK